jgi:hypothetical protein
LRSWLIATFSVLGQTLDGLGVVAVGDDQRLRAALRARLQLHVQAGSEVVLAGLGGQLLGPLQDLVGHVLEYRGDHLQAEHGLGGAVIVGDVADSTGERHQVPPSHSFSEQMR